MTQLCEHGCGREAHYLVSAYRKRPARWQCGKHHLNCPAVLERRKNTNVSRYGGTAPACSKSVRDKMEQSTLKNFGVANISSLQATKDKKVTSSMKKYGVDNVSRAVEVRKKISDYQAGISDHQRKEMIERQKKTAKKPKVYVLPNGNSILVQGYESWALNILFYKFNENEVVFGRDVPVMNLVFNKKPIKHYPDIYIPEINKIIEVKSTFTYGNKFLSLNIAKKEAAISSGFLYEFWVFDAKGSLKMC